MFYQAKLAALPVKSKAWWLHFQIGDPGHKEDGDYMSSQFIIPHEEAMMILQGERAMSLRAKSLEAYFRGEQSQSDLGFVSFGGKIWRSVEEILNHVTKNIPFDVDFHESVSKEMEDAATEFKETQEKIKNKAKPGMVHWDDK